MLRPEIVPSLVSLGVELALVAPCAGVAPHDPVAAVAAGVGIWGMSQGLGYGAAWKALGSKLAAQTTASGNLLLGSRVPMLAAEKSRSRRARRRA